MRYLRVSTPALVMAVVLAVFDPYMPTQKANVTVICTKTKRVATCVGRSFDMIVTKRAPLRQPG